MAAVPFGGRRHGDRRPDPERRSASSSQLSLETNRAPAPLSQPDAIYPVDCRQAGIEGEVLVQFVVKPDGTTGLVKAVASPDERLSAAATAAVARWTFSPGIQAGHAVVTQMQIPISFTIDHTPKKAPVTLTKPDHPPVLVEAVSPFYPPGFAAKQVEGEVLVKFVVGPDGSTGDLSAVRSTDARLTPYAIRAVAQWRFTAGTKDGKAVYCLLEVPVEFKARKPSPKAASDTEFSAGNEGEAEVEEGERALEAGSFAIAAEAFTKALRTSPASAKAHLGRAKAFAALKREDEALDEFTRAAALDSSDQPALEAYRTQIPETPARIWSALRYHTFDAVWTTVNETYFDPTFGGVDWDGVREKYRALLPSAGDNARLLALMQQMLGELHRTHFAIIPRQAAVFNPSERVRIGTVGVEVAWIEGGVAVTEVKEGSKGESVPLRPGDQVLAVDRQTLASLEASLASAGVTPARAHSYLTRFVESRLNGPVGTAVELVAASDLEPSRKVSLTCRATELSWSEPVGYFPSMPIRCETSRDADGIAVFRFNVFVPPVMKTFRDFERGLRPGDALIIDLRGNGGGISQMASGMSGWLCGDEFVLATMRQRSGTLELGVYPQAHGFAGPVAVLIDGESASTSEILAAGLREHGRIRIFGEPSAGAALPSLFKSLPTGDLFQYAIADVKTPSGVLLEGKGVLPDEAAAATRADLAAGRDPVAEAARRWIAANRARATP